MVAQGPNTSPRLPDESRLLGQVCAVFTPRSLAANRAQRLLEDPALAPFQPPSAVPFAAQISGLTDNRIAEYSNGELAIGAEWGLRILREAREEGVLLPFSKRLSG